MLVMICSRGCIKKTHRNVFLFFDFPLKYIPHSYPVNLETFSIVGEIDKTWKDLL